MICFTTQTKVSSLELETKHREVLTIIEKAPARAFNQEKVLVGAFVSSSSDDTLVRVVKQIIAEPSRTGSG